MCGFSLPTLGDVFQEIKDTEKRGSKKFWFINIIQIAIVTYIVVILTLNWKTFYVHTNTYNFLLLWSLIGESTWRSIMLIFRCANGASTCAYLAMGIRVLFLFKAFANPVSFFCLVSFQDINASINIVDGSHFFLYHIDMFHLLMFFCLSARRRHAELVAENNVALEVIENLPTHILTTIRVDDKCPICFEEYMLGEQIKTLPCKHYYHAVCIDRWLHKKQTCPNCRGAIVVSPITIHVQGVV